jgi:hypothetical protein
MYSPVEDSVGLVFESNNAGVKKLLTFDGTDK